MSETQKFTCDKNCVYQCNHMNHINTRCNVTNCQSRWYVYIPVDRKVLV
jgi:hypothetical protein